MTDQPFNRTVIYPLEKPLADDLNQEFSQADYTIRDTMFQLLQGQQGFIWDSFQCSQGSPPALEVVMKQGVGWQDAPTDVPTSINSVQGLNDLCRYKPLKLGNDLTVAVPAPPGANSRIDLIEVRYNRQVDNPQSRNFLDPNTNAFSPATVPKTLDFNLDGTLAYYAAVDVPTTAIAYKSGVVAVSPVAPTVDAGYMAVAYITVVNGATTIVTADISDQRNAILLAPGTFLGRQKITANGTYTPTPGTRRIFLRMCGGGGGGGGSGATGAGTGAAGGGGASGIYLEWMLSGAPYIAGGTVVIGAAGAAGGAPGAGGTGGDTQIDINAVTITAKGGFGGALGTANLAPPAAEFGGRPQTGSSVGDFTTADAGEIGLITGNAGGEQSMGGWGGGGRLGIGGNDLVGGAGVAGSGYGAGGSGGSGYNGDPAFAGGAGTAGVVIIDEYA